MDKQACQNLRKWFLEIKRDFPWRKTRDPYAIWVSEIMLQQTQASVVVDYYNRWMNALPTIEHLAKASEEQVLKLWEGLGYYSRARNLQKGARKIISHFKGQVPNTEKELLSIPGIGPYTQGAIRSFAFKKKAAAIDGNVSRVVCRYYAHERKCARFIHERLEELLPEEQPYVIMEALIELGALCCKKRALCSQCPIQKGCIAKKLRLTEKIPKVEKKTSIKHLTSTVLVVYMRGKLLLEQRTSKLWRGMWQFPTNCPIPPKSNKYPSIFQTYTHHKEELVPYFIKVEYQDDYKGRWVEVDKILYSIPLTAGHRKIFNQFLKLEYPSLYEKHMLAVINGGYDGTDCIP